MSKQFLTTILKSFDNKKLDFYSGLVDLMKDRSRSTLANRRIKER